MHPIAIVLVVLGLLGATLMTGGLLKRHEMRREQRHERDRVYIRLATLGFRMDEQVALHGRFDHDSQRLIWETIHAWCIWCRHLPRGRSDYSGHMIRAMEYVVEANPKYPC